MLLLVDTSAHVVDCVTTKGYVFTNPDLNAKKITGKCLRDIYPPHHYNITVAVLREARRLGAAVQKRLRFRAGKSNHYRTVRASLTSNPELYLITLFMS
jgi:hypothetical protein